MPRLDGVGSVYLAVGIIGATVMPHVIYLHSALTKGRMPCRDERERGQVLRFERLDGLARSGSRGWSIWRCSLSRRRCFTRRP